MAEKKQSDAAQQQEQQEQLAQQAEQQGFCCPGDCIQCETSQRLYCAAQNSYYVMRMVQAMTAQMRGMADTILELREKVNTLEDRQRKKGTAQKVEPRDN